uniref:DDE_3 domain-containing protein n=1 Tax=Heterorhabditis bacteriophora TaxID=37862 RepID=A0A1I7WAX5_HETBA
MEWPSQSPALNPIVHLWNDVEKEVRRQKPSNIKELEAVIKNFGYPTNVVYNNNNNGSDNIKCLTYLDMRISSAPYVHKHDCKCLPKKDHLDKDTTDYLKMITPFRIR